MQLSYCSVSRRRRDIRRSALEIFGYAFCRKADVLSVAAASSQYDADRRRVASPPPAILLVLCGMPPAGSAAIDAIYTDRTRTRRQATKRILYNRDTPAAAAAAVAGNDGAAAPHLSYSRRSIRLRPVETRPRGPTAHCGPGAELLDEWRCREPDRKAGAA